MRPDKRNGTSLLEVLFVSAVSAIIVTGAAMQFRTVRQVSDLVQQRRDATQNGRVALSRMARQLRGAKGIVAITEPEDSAGSITIADWDSVNHVFTLVGTELLYGVDTAEHLLAENIQAFEVRSFNSSGAASHSKPDEIVSVEISLETPIPGSAETRTVSTRAYIRHSGLGVPVARTSKSYATVYTPGDDGIADYWNCYGEPDGLFGYSPAKISGELHGYSTGAYTGRVYRIFAGLYMKGFVRPCSMYVKWNGTEITSYEFTSKEGDDYETAFNWKWLDITDALPSQQLWQHSDIPAVAIGIDGNGLTQIDAACVRAFYDPPQTADFYAEAQGSGPNEWGSPDRALGIPDDVYAFGTWASSSAKQTYRTTVTDLEEAEILSVHVLFELFVAPVDANCSLSAALVDPNEPSGTSPEQAVSDLSPWAGSYNENEHNVELDFSYDRPWSQAEINSRELYAVAGGTGSTTIGVDSICWRIVYVPKTGKGILRWEE